MANATDNLMKAEKLIKRVIDKRFSDKADKICRWLLSFNGQEGKFKIKCYATGESRPSSKPDIRFCIDRGSDCEGTKIMTGFVVIEPNFEIMGLYSNNSDMYSYFKPDQKRWRIGSEATSQLPDETITKHILESYCLKIKDLGLDSVVCNLNDRVSRPKGPPHECPNGSYIPSKEDFDTAYRTLAKPGQEVIIDAVLDQIEHSAKKAGHNLEENWRMITERNIEIWSK
jgi:hypothetical protein